MSRLSVSSTAPYTNHLTPSARATLDEWRAEGQLDGARGTPEHVGSHPVAVAASLLSDALGAPVSRRALFAHLHHLGWIERTVSTYVVAPGVAAALGRGRRGVTMPALLSELRDAIRPNQGGTGKGSPPGPKLPFDVDAVELYRQLQQDIASIYTSATEKPAEGTPEQLLRDWLIEFELSWRTGDVILPQLQAAASRFRTWQHRIEDYLTPPTTREDPLCPVCGHTHHQVLVDGQLIQQRCVIRMAWPEHTGRKPRAECRHCGARWIGLHQDPRNPDQPTLRDLDDAIEANIADYGPLDGELAIAPYQDRTDQTA